MVPNQLIGGLNPSFDFNQKIAERKDFLKYKYRIKSDRIDAIQVTRANHDDIIAFGGDEVVSIEIPRTPNGVMRVVVSEGNTIFSVYEGDYLIRNKNDSLSSFNKNTFEKMYEKDNRLIISDHLTDDDMEEIAEEAVDYMVKHFGYERR